MDMSVDGRRVEATYRVPVGGLGTGGSTGVSGLGTHPPLPVLVSSYLLPVPSSNPCRPVPTSLFSTLSPVLYPTLAPLSVLPLFPLTSLPHLISSLLFFLSSPSCLSSRFAATPGMPQVAAGGLGGGGKL